MDGEVSTIKTPPLPRREGIEGRGKNQSTPTLTLPRRRGRGDFIVIRARPAQFDLYPLSECGGFESLFHPLQNPSDQRLLENFEPAGVLLAVEGGKESIWIEGYPLRI